MFFVESLRVVAAAIEAEAVVEQLVWCDAMLTSEFGRNLVTRSAIPITEVSESVFHSLSQRENPIGLGALIATESKRLSDLTVGKDSVFVALDGISDPGNLGTIIRTIDSLGASGVILIGNTVDRWHSSVLKASMGAFFSVPSVAVASVDELLQWAAIQQITTIATSAKASVSSRKMAVDGAALLLMGAEKSGLSAEILDRANLSVSIPMNANGSSSSLNLAVATAILLYELCN